MIIIILIHSKLTYILYQTIGWKLLNSQIIRTELLLRIIDNHLPAQLKY